MPKVSVIVTTYNRKDLLGETIQSILNQTFVDFELIIVDNYSNYNFVNYVTGFNDSRIKPFQNANNGVIAVNRNFGMRNAEGELIALCDDDDLWESNKLEKQLNLFLKNNKITLIATASSIIGKVSNSLIQKIRSKLLLFILSLNLVPAKYMLLIFYYITNSSVMFKKSITEKIGLLNESIEYIAVEDYDMWLRISRIGKIYFLNENLVKYRFHNSQVSNETISETNKKITRVVKHHWHEMNKLQKIIFSCKRVQWK